MGLSSKTPTFDIGALAVLSVVFKDAAGTLTDPTTVTAEAISPLGVTVQLSPSRDSVGNWHANLDLTDAYPGVWTYRFTGTGALQAAEEDVIFVEKSAFS